MSEGVSGTDVTGAFAEHLEKLTAKGLERARDVVARIPSEPGWRACVLLSGAKLEGDRVECLMYLIPITHWGIMRPVHAFGMFAGAAATFGGFMGGGASDPVPMGENGAVLNGEGFWGLAAPHETNEEIGAKFEAEARKMDGEVTRGR
jgi:hypothetical protein